MKRGSAWISVKRELQDFWLIELDLEVRFLDGEIRLIGASSPAEVAEAIKNLEVVARSADENDYGLIARNARRLIKKAR